MYLRERLKGPINLTIFSDDPEWAKKNVQFDYPNEVIDWRNYILPESRSAYAMYLMSVCKHQIIANSSWSWWAA
ncbi:MAG: alpha-1,2-fucosyltransferase [Candidatus Helarchaeota archaeon]|nr:alpha-1,2-fucosyltransferase [Candidatus Helarchaeota archaeon]